MTNKLVHWFSLGLVLFILDRFFKWLALHDPNYLFAPTDWLKFSFWSNQNIVFGLWPVDFFVLFLLFIIWMSLLAIGWQWFKKEKFLPVWFLGLIVIGGFSNLWDRVYYQGVIDYIHLWLLPVFNFSDCLIVVGALGTVLSLSFEEKSK